MCVVEKCSVYGLNVASGYWSLHFDFNRGLVPAVPCPAPSTSTRLFQMIWRRQIPARVEVAVLIKGPFEHIVSSKRPLRANIPCPTLDPPIDLRQNLVRDATESFQFFDGTSRNYIFPCLLPLSDFVFE